MQLKFFHWVSESVFEFQKINSIPQRVMDMIISLGNQVVGILDLR